jgi:MFS family permease
MAQKNTFRNLTLLVASTLTVMAGAVIAPALPEISRQYHYLPNAELLSKLILTLPALVIAVLAPLTGYFVDKAGRKPVLIFSLIVYAVAGTTGLYLSDIYLILAGRALLGLAVGGLMTSVVTLFGDLFAGEERSRFMGYQAAFAGIGGLLFISGGGLLADIHWRAPFLIYAFSIPVLASAWIFVSEPDRKMPASTDGPLPARSHSEMPPGENPSREHSANIPPMVYLIYLIAFFSMAVFYMVPVQMPFMLSALDGISNTKVGIAIAFMNITSVSMALNYGWVKRKLSFAGVMALVYVFIAAGYLIISQSQSYWIIIAGILTAGLGFGLQMANMNLWLVSLAPPDMRGRLVGYLNAAIFLGMFLSPILLQPLVRLTSLYQSFMLVALLLLLLSGVFCYAGGRGAGREKKVEDR